MITHLFDFHAYRCIEKCIWWRMAPIAFILIGEFRGRQMTRYAGHEHIASSPGRTKVKSECVVLDVLVASVSLR